MKAKIVTSYIILLSCMNSYTQEFNARHIKKLEKLHIQYKQEYSHSEQTTKELHQILRFDSKRKAKETIGTVLFSLGIATLAGGALVTKDTKNSQYDQLQYIFGSTLMLVGATEIGVSIPIFISAKKSRTSRDLLKRNYPIYQSNNAAEISNLPLEQNSFMKY